jgi:hypothetical protein
MKKHATLLFMLLATTMLVAQKKDKIKGTKTVTMEQREIGDFAALEVEDNLEIHLERGEKPALKIEADDNLHDIIAFDLRDKALRIYTTKEAVSYKKLMVRITYTADLNQITSKNDATVNAIQEIQSDSLTFRAHDFSQLYLNVNAKKFLLQADDKSKTELNLKSENTVVELSKSAELKALISTTDLKVDLYQKAEATLSGDASHALIRLDNNATLTGNKLTAENADITTESYSSCSLNATTTVIIDAADQSEVQLVGSPKIEIRQFADEAKLVKKLK